MPQDVKINRRTNQSKETNWLGFRIGRKGAIFLKIAGIILIVLGIIYLIWVIIQLITYLLPIATGDFVFNASENFLDAVFFVIHFVLSWFITWFGKYCNRKSNEAL